MLLSLLATAGAATSAPPHETPPHVVRWRDAIDWRLAGDEAVSTLSAYLAVDSVNPPGNEDRAVAFLGAILDAEHVPWSTIPLAEGRSSLVARVKGTGKASPLCLLSHTDVASFEAERWSSPDRGPLSGAVADGHVWGRGALDMKGMGTLELLTVVWLQRLQVPLDRDVILLAVADEEVDNGGARSLVAPEVWKDLGCSHVINEGGVGIDGALFDGQAVHAISVAEKGALWVKVVATGQAGHGSVVRGLEEAPARLLRAMTRIDEGYRPEYRVDPALYDLLAAAGEQRGGAVGLVLQTPFLVRTLAWSKLRGNPATNATLHDTVHLTGTGGAAEPNVVPSEVWAQYDCRLLPGTTPEVQLDRLRKLVKDVPGIELRTEFALEANGSPADDPWFATIAHYAAEGREERVAVGPFLSVGFTDSLLLRPLGVRAYGYVPFEVSPELAETMHGHDERVPVAQVGDGLRRLFSMVVDFAGSP